MRLFGPALAALIFLLGCAALRSKVAVQAQQSPPCDYSDSGCVQRK